jgi:hypothetical protein
MQWQPQWQVHSSSRGLKPLTQQQQQQQHEEEDVSRG